MTMNKTWSLVQAQLTIPMMLSPKKIPVMLLSVQPHDWAMRNVRLIPK